MEEYQHRCKVHRISRLRVSVMHTSIDELTGAYFIQFHLEN